MVTDLSIELAGIKLKNPVMAASGTFGYGKEYSEFCDLNQIGAIVTKSITLKPKEGNPPPRIAETPSGILNAIGLQSDGVEKFIAKALPFLEKFDVPVIASIAGGSKEEFAELAKILSKSKRIAGLELNISCPNVKKGGMLFGCDPDAAAEVTKAARKATKLPLIVKLSPNVTDITLIAKAVEKAGADALSLINTLLGMAIDINTKKPKLGNITGGLSGPAIRPIAIRMVWQTAQAVKIPIVGMGGIMTAEDAIEFFLAGASAVQVGTGNFVDPKCIIKIIEGLYKAGPDLLTRGDF
ncbi:dihydroorotate dehydrogenase B catalytic subunit [candidate division WOR-1 bacterium RIFOXYA12_FULL_43_27]|uniref:Dihydroorotate dehydrogenase n=1 Tax=candidate division WOR-1 bacterium RIFOXYC2_FULL_46_14 TaxID=1802587 RepID=A0A1F4U977_UNCSA|nr:MAG: dihydroorotate dehydrogenase B catalytic subunit [candidate division WOR-1 bacterium RIFOXYA12_FULL_43_27]OGC19253.1 MAG: dihydroorotate dehydrogenase B catalytic subunit [candidate division WOR-1 bacterium RIFOXYB2_FULL_46_45]OGC30242.1 MAG: dihydroorotate dehydrogenase B catalytic subunit [candidate division WOR-1 bacterium RIFOXYA2_FULL_46_56]OGC40843.1 MAG: dihydroorotate dehydrogenase B catalytic subunit [candidate division WOR-1 bacterium RIFOXYC2_FULL_46_14]